MAVFDTNYYMTLGAALATGKEEPSGKDIKEFAKKAGFLAEKDRLSAIQDRRKQYEVIMSALSEENFDRMNLSFKYQQERNKIIRALTDKALDANQTKSLITALEKNQADGEKILEDLNTHSWPELEEIIDKSIEVQGGNRNKGVVLALTRDNAYADGTKIVNPQNLAQANSMRKALESVEYGGEKVFVFDEQGILTNYDELVDEQNSPLLKLGFDASELPMNVFRNENNIFNQYNVNRQLILDDLGSINEENSKIRLKIEQLKAARDPQEILRIRKEIADGLTMLDEVMRDGAGMELENVEQLGEELEIYKERRANAQGLKDEIEQLSRKPKSEHTAEDKQLLSKMERRAANPYIREWAADHGFDEMGTVAYDENGQPIPGSYAPGRDDAAVAKTFEREFNRGAGRYGFRSIGSGDIVQFQHEGPDGEVKTLVGERLKFHAADRGAVRVAVPGIEEPIVIPRDSGTRFVVLERKPDKMSPLARRAKGLMFRRGDRIESLSNRFKIDDRSESVAREDGRLILDKATGRYIEQSDFDESLASKLAETEFVGKLVGDKEYLVDPNGNVFAMDRDSDGNRKLSAVEDEALLEAVNAAESRAVTVINFDEDGEEMYSPLTQAALDSGEYAELGLANLESDEGGIPEEDSVIFEGVAKQRRTQALQGMNVEFTDEEYDPLRGRTKNETSVAGHLFVELDGSPQAIQEYNEVEQTKAQQEGRPPQVVTPVAEPILEEIEASTADEAADTAAPENQTDARSKADKLAEVLAEKRTGDDRPDIDPELVEDDPLDFGAMSDEEAEQRVKGEFKPGATEFTDTDEIAGVPSDIGSIESKTSRSAERERGEDDPPKLPSLKRGVYEGKGGYKYEVDFNGNITIVDSPRGRGRGASVKPGTAAHRAVVTELSQGPDPKPKGLDMAQITPLLASIGASTVKAADAVGEVEKPEADEVTEAAGTPASVNVPGQGANPNEQKENKKAMKDLQEKRRPALEQGVQGRKEESAQRSAMFQNMLATTNTDVQGIDK